jgi:hypothetical protein
VRRILSIGTRTTDSPKEPCRRVPKLSTYAPDPGLHGLARKGARTEWQRARALEQSRLEGGYLHHKSMGLQMLAITHVLQEAQINRLGTIYDGEFGGLRNDGAHLCRDTVSLAQQ